MTQQREHPYLVYRGQVAVSISEGWVDLNGAGVALQGALYILHLFERVAHVGICISKSWGYSRDG